MTQRPLAYKPLCKNLTAVVVDGVETAAIDIDVRRFNRALEKVVQAIYFHESGKKLLARIQVQSQLLLAWDTETVDVDNANVLNYGRAIALALAKVHAPLRGNNPEVFTYQLERDAEEISPMADRHSSKALTSSLVADTLALLR